jgi:hypothetical protein
MITNDKVECIQTTAFWVVMLCSLVDGANVSKECAVSVFKAQDASTLKLETASSSEMFVPIYKTIWCQTPE